MSLWDRVSFCLNLMRNQGFRVIKERSTMVKIYYCSACRASQGERSVIFQLVDDIYICDTCVDQMAEMLKKERFKQEENQSLDDVQAAVDGLNQTSIE